MLWLLFFGVLHAYLLWYGDILYTYAMCGMIVYLFRRLSPRGLVALAALFYVIGSAIYLGVGWSMQFWPQEALDGFTQQGWAPSAAMVDEELAAYRGGWFMQLPHRVMASFFFQTFIFASFVLWKTVANMLLGMALFKSGVLSAACDRAFYARLAAAGFGIGLPLAIIGIWRNTAAGWSATYSFFTGSQYNYWAAVAVDMGWIGLWMLIILAGALPGLTARLAAVGQMAFSNYILQTLIATTLFYGHGFGLYGYTSRVEQAALVVAVWVLQLATSPMWLRRYYYGPLEWLWRSLTYRHRMPMRRPAAA